MLFHPKPSSLPPAWLFLFYSNGGAWVSKKMPLVSFQKNILVNINKRFLYRCKDWVKL
jgi:hypothetical protein